MLKQIKLEFIYLSFSYFSFCCLYIYNIYKYDRKRDLKKKIILVTEFDLYMDEMSSFKIGVAIRFK